MWKVIKDLYTNVKAQVLYAGSLSTKIDVTGQGRILAPFMYKVYVNGILCVLTNHCYAIFINELRIPSPSFPDDITLLALHPSFLGTFINKCYKYGIKWRYEFNDSKSGIVAFVESKPQHFESMKNRVSLLRDTILDELYEYKNLGMLKIFVDSFSSNVEGNINRTRKKVDLIFTSNFDRCKVNLLVYMKLWKQACLPSAEYIPQVYRGRFGRKHRFHRVRYFQLFVVITTVPTEE